MYKAEKVFLFIRHVARNEFLYTFLQNSGHGHILVFKLTSGFKKSSKMQAKENVDAKLVLHPIIEFPNYDKTIIVSGDGDFHCLVEYLEKQSKFLNVLLFYASIDNILFILVSLVEN